MILDTSGLLALFHRSEPHHPEAAALYDNGNRRFTHNYILAEFIPLATARGFRRDLALEFTLRLLAAPEVETIWITESLHRQAMDLLDAREDKGYSLCDAVSFVLMRQRGIVEALTTDHHFEQEGFVRLLT
jgi:uncharacterized protein